MVRAKRHYIPGYVWHTPVKQGKKRFNGVNENREWSHLNLI